MLDSALIMSCNVGAIIRGSSRAVITAARTSVRYYMAVSRDTCYGLAHLTAPNKSTLSETAKSKRASSGKRLRLFSLLVTLSFFIFIYMFVTTNKPTNSIKHSHSSESDRFSGSQEIPLVCENWNFIAVFKAAATSPCPEPDASNPSPHPISSRLFSIRFSQISQGLQNGLVPSGTSTKIPSMHLFKLPHLTQEYSERDHIFCSSVTQ